MSMSRIPAVEWLRIAEPVKSIEAFADKVAVAEQSMPKPMATLTALQYEAVATINRLAVLVDRSGNSVLIDKAAVAIERWNQTVSAAEFLVKQ
jgi:hypothetical protein